jgi:hypothetical protein
MITETPIVVLESGDVLFFRSLSCAERYLEPMDIRNDEHIAYDSEGRLLRLIPCKHIVKIELAEEESTHANELKDALVSFFVEVDYATEDWLSKASLRELVLRGLSDFETK